MDRVRLGRALGKGARQLARTAMEAADAAASAPAQQPEQRRSRPAVPQVIPPREAAATTARAAAQASAHIGSAMRSAGEGVMPSVRRAGRALWLELTGVFFALFALSFGAGVWKTRAAAASDIAADRNRFYAFCALTLVFAYFSVSSFLRARRKA